MYNCVYQKEEQSFLQLKLHVETKHGDTCIGEHLNLESLIPMQIMIVPGNGKKNKNKRIYEACS